MSRPVKQFQLIPLDLTNPVAAAPPPDSAPTPTPAIKTTSSAPDKKFPFEEILQNIPKNFHSKSALMIEKLSDRLEIDPDTLEVIYPDGSVGSYFPELIMLCLSNNIDAVPWDFSKFVHEIVNLGVPLRYVTAAARKASGIWKTLD